MKTILEKIRNFFNAPCRDAEIEQRFYQRLEDMKNHPEKYPHILKRDSSGSKIPPVSLF
jgi:hypothetical protein